MAGVSRRRRNAARHRAAAVASRPASPSLRIARTTPQALAEVALADLPKEAQDVHALVGKGGPFPYDRDGVVFGNREQLLPAKPRGYYHEYTVRTPGVKSRGGRRLVCGGPAQSPRRLLLHR